MRKLAALIAMNLLIALQVVNSQNTLYNYFPEKIRVLIAVKPLDIGSKIPAEVLNESFIVRSAQEKDRNDNMLEILRDLRSTGLFLDEAFVLVSEGSQPGTKITQLLVKLENPSTFRSFLVEKMELDAAKIKTYGTDNLIFPDEETVIAWNNKVLILASEKGDDMSDFLLDTLTEGDYEKWYTERNEKKQRSLRNLAFELLTPRPGNAFVQDARFQALMSEPGEMKIWNQDNSEPLGTVIPVPHILSQLSKWTTGLKTTAIEFAAGKIVARTRSYPGEELAALMEKNPPMPAGEEFLDLIPEGKILALVNGAISNEMLNELLNKPAFLELADSLKKHSSFDIRQLPSIFGNKMMGALVYNENAEPAIDLVIGLPIRDQAGFTRMQAEVGRLIDSLKGDDNSDFGKKFRPVVRSNEKMVAISLSERTARNFLEKKQVQALPAHLREYTKYPAMITLDLPELIRTFVMRKVQEQSPEELHFLNKLGEIRIYGGEFSKGATTMTAEINFKDPNQNSLAQLFGIMNGAMEMMMKNKSEDMEENDYDTTTVSVDTTFYPDQLPPPPAISLVPDLKDAKAEKFLEEFGDVVIAYRQTFTDSAIDIEAKKNYLLWEERARVMEKNLTDKEDAEKFREYVLKLKELLKEEE